MDTVNRYVSALITSVICLNISVFIKHLFGSFVAFLPDLDTILNRASYAKLTALRTSMAWPSSRSKVTTHTHSNQEEKRLHGHRLSPPSAASSCRGEPQPYSEFITTGSELLDLQRPSPGPPSLEYRYITLTKQCTSERGLRRPLLEKRRHCTSQQEALKNCMISFLLSLLKTTTKTNMATGSHDS